jgi:quinolinate synthase
MNALLRQSHVLHTRKSLFRFHSTGISSYSSEKVTFPSLVIGPKKSIVPQGSFAEAQARVSLHLCYGRDNTELLLEIRIVCIQIQDKDYTHIFSQRYIQYLDPDPEIVTHLGQSLLAANMGVVAHYYMDVELQGILSAVQRQLPEFRIGIADSLAMGDMAVKMCHETGVTALACLGVDFMSESVAAILDRNNLGNIPIYRSTARSIGCSLAEAAERTTYRAWLEREATHPALHVVYINTSLETKAISSSIVPTMACTSSNVLATLLQASAQVPNLKILYGPDTYMGQNLQTLLDTILNNGWTDDRIQNDLHSLHTRQSIENLRNNLLVFPHGNCIVHHMFGNAVVQAVKQYYDDCFVTAHLEVPGEMFSIAMEKSLLDRGVVGSTSDILRFITRKVTEDATIPNNSTSSQRRLRFILGTEAGMVTSIVRSVQDIMEKAKSSTEVEIIFPVSSEAVMGVDGDPNLSIVPGSAGGEGCSTAGGCATCPFMKMNDIDALQKIIEMVRSGHQELELKSHLPPNRLKGKKINGINALDLGAESIMYMREFMATKQMPISLIDRLCGDSNS